MNNGYSMITGPSLNGLIDINADTIASSSITSSTITSTSVATDTIYLNGVDIGTSISQIPINAANISNLQLATTDISYNSGTDTTNINNNVVISGTLSTTGNIVEPTITANTLTITPTELSCLDSIGSNIQTQLNNKVSLTGAETINGIKTFSSVPVCATNATTSSQLTNKAYVDSVIGAATTVNVAGNDSATTYYPVFTSTGAGQKSLLFDTTATPLSYIPSTSTLTVSNYGIRTTIESSLSASGANINITNNNISGIINYTVATSGLPLSIMSLSETNTYFRVPFYLSTAVAANSNIFSINDSTSTKSLTFVPSVSADGNYNNMTRAGDSLLYVSNTGLTNNLTITTQQSGLTAAVGIRITPTSVLIGAGGTTTVSTNSILLDNSNVSITSPNLKVSTSSRVLLDLSTTNVCIGGNGTDYALVLSADGNRVSTTAKIMRLFSNTTNAYIDTGIGYETGTVPLLFRSGVGLERFRTNDTGILMANTNIFGRNDGDAFTTIPSGAGTQPIGFSINVNVVITSAVVTNTTLTTVLLDAGVWIMNVCYGVNKGTGTINTGSYIACYLNTGTGYTGYPSSAVAGDLIPISSTFTGIVYRANCSRTIVVSTVGRTVSPIIYTQMVMATYGNSNGTLLCGFTKIA